MTLPAPLADPQLLRLEQLLGDPALAQAMRLDEAHGYLCAALSGPRPLAEEQWLSEVLGSTDSEANDILCEAASLLRIFVSELETGLARGEPPVLLLYPAEGRDDGAGDYVPWCQAYLHGVDAAAEDWFDALGAEDGKEDSEEICYLDEQLFPLFMLTGDAEAAALAAGEDWLSGEELDRLQLECEEKLPQAVSDIYRFWVAQRSIKTIRRELPKVGRNDPCPCGSGKKFKKCCDS
ncbi:MAG: UPF0149 family protein [Candidatus Accumulibacter sp.]|nr:UPF0149 family protein [Accumulibacter sp.]